MVATLGSYKKKLELDEDGFLKNIDNWGINVVDYLAKLEGIKDLMAEHWKLIAAARFYYEKNGMSPLCRDILNETGFTKQDIYRLFPKGHRSVYKLAGLPKPPEC